MHERVCFWLLGAGDFLIVIAGENRRSIAKCGRQLSCQLSNVTPFILTVSMAVCLVIVRGCLLTWGEAIMKRLCGCTIVAAVRMAIVETMVPAWNRILLFKQCVILLFNKLSALLMLCGCSKIIVKPGVKVITIEPSADGLSMSAR